jgi:lysophospholipase L1-like esterase
MGWAWTAALCVLGLALAAAGVAAAAEAPGDAGGAGGGPEAVDLPEGMSPSANALARPEALKPFWDALSVTARGGRAVVLHLGDSHLQSDLLSRPLRRDFQARFGDAGRGLVFPYSVAHTTEAEDVVDESSAAWIARRGSVRAPADAPDLDPGLSGFALLTRECPWVLRLGLKDGETFDRVTVFRRSGPEASALAVSLHADPEVLERAGAVTRDVLHIVRPGDTLYALARANGVKVPQLLKWNRLEDSGIWPGDRLVVGHRREAAAGPLPGGFEDVGILPGGAEAPFEASVSLPRPVSDVFLRAAAPLSPGASCVSVLDGLVLEHAGASGVLYHAAGVNGAQARHFARSPRFLDEAHSLKPDLLILSFGTNESDGGDEAVAALVPALEKLAAALATGGTGVLVTTPPDGLAWNGRRNPRIARVAQVLREAAAAHGWALWDWNAVMGGAGTARRWRALGLMERDGVHCTAAGYRLQERFLWKALMEAYERR